VPLTDKAKEVSAFVTSKGFFQYRPMPFGMKNAPATFQRMVNHLMSDLRGCEGYIFYVIMHSESFEAHLLHIRSFT
jgi:hypothetical protein